METELGARQQLAAPLLRVAAAFLGVVLLTWALTFSIQFSFVEQFVQIRFACDAPQADFDAATAPARLAHFGYHSTVVSSDPHSVTFRWTGFALLAPEMPLGREVLPDCRVLGAETRTTPLLAGVLPYLIPSILIAAALLPANRKYWMRADRASNRRIVAPALLLIGWDACALWLTQAYPSLAGDAPKIELFESGAWVRVVLLAPIAEEIWFRGTLQARVAATGHPKLGVLFGAYFFAAFHYLMAPLQTGVWRVFVVFVIGLILGWAMLRTRSLAWAIGLHMANNASAVLLAWLSKAAAS